MIEVKPDGDVIKLIYLDPGVYAKRVRIAKVRDFSNYPLHPEAEPKTYGKNKKEPEQCIEVEFIDGDYQKTKAFWRKWQKDKETKQQIGWATWRNPVLMFFIATLGEEGIKVNDDWTIPNDMLISLINKEIWMIQYQTNRFYDNEEEGSNHWAGYVRDYLPFTFNLAYTQEKLKEFWDAGLSYTQDYARDIAVQKENERKESKKTAEIDKTESYTDDDKKETKTNDDDLPF